jgi:hypothetical protein
MFTREQVEQQIALAYKTGFHAGIKWVKEGGNNERTVRAKRPRRSAT